MNRVVSSLVIISCLAVVSCKQKQTPPTPPVPVNLMKATARRVLYYDRYPATTVALSQVDLHAQVTGYIMGIYFTEGTHVTKGQKLYSIDERLYLASVDQAKANLRVDSGNLKQVQQDADRYVYLNKYNAVATQLVDHALISLQNAKDSVIAAQQQLKTAETNLTYANIYAPFDGTIGISQVRLGNLITPGTTVLNTISTDNPMAVDFLVNEAQLGHFLDLKNHKQAEIDSLFTIVLPNQQVYSQLGKISIIDRAVDPQTGAITVRATFPNPDYSMRAGMSCVMRVHNQEESPVIVIPSKAIVEQMGEYFVFVAKDSTYKDPADSANKKADTVQTPKLRAFQVKVQEGQTIGPNVVIRAGLNEGDMVVVDGVQALHDGSVVTTSNKPAGGKGKPGAGEGNGGAAPGGSSGSAGNAGSKQEGQ
jgi:membrane fusion protein (multidrug efflux system)